MPTTRTDDLRAPSRAVATGLPVRVVLFLRAVGTHSGIRATMARGGFGSRDHEEGFRLLERVCAYDDCGVDPNEDRPAQEALEAISSFVQLHFARLRAALEQLHPASVHLFSGIESPAPVDAVVALATLLERIDTLDVRRERGVLATLAARAFDAAARLRLSELVKLAMSAPKPHAAGPMRTDLSAGATRPRAIDSTSREDGHAPR